MIYLYLKEHEITGLKYLGQTKRDPFKYKGSGVYWKQHLKKHGNKVKTTILAECETYEELQILGLQYSEKWDVVKSHLFANLMVENGLSNKFTPEIIEKIAKSNRGQKRSEETKAKISKGGKGRKLSEETKAKIKAARAKQISQPHSEETKAKIKAKRATQKMKPHSEETKAKISSAAKIQHIIKKQLQAEGDERPYKRITND